MGRKFLVHTFEDIISLENLLGAWREFARGKKSRKDVQWFGRHLGDNLLGLYQDLASLSYRHAPYEHFRVNDPKPRDIHKATVRDRIVHRALYRVLYPFFDRTFIADSYSCRRWKGTHKAIQRFEEFARKVSCNDTRTAWVLRCDIRKFFASIDHHILFQILRTRISDKKLLWLLYQVVHSFHSGSPDVGLPLGNLTSQLLVNVYMNEFDQFVKHRLKIRRYIRYADDFVILHHDRGYLSQLVPVIKGFLADRLALTLHPDKLSIATLASGVDFLGWVHFPHHRVVRTTTKKRMLRNVKNEPNDAMLASYHGMLRHGNAYGLAQRLG